MPSDFGAPFEFSDADVVLRSNDQVDFLAHKLVLSIASPFFRDYHFDNSPTNEEREDGLPIVLLSTEDAGTVERLLRLCYPVPPPTWESLVEVRRVLEACQKYQLDAAAQRVPAVLMESRFVEEQYLATYAIACGYKMESVARAAARASLLASNLSSGDPDVLRCMTGEDYHRLVQYRKSCLDAARLTTEERGFRSLAFRRDWCWFQCKTCAGILGKGRSLQIYTDSNLICDVKPRAWWWNYVLWVRQALNSRIDADVVDVAMASLLTVTLCPQCELVAD